MKYKELLKNWFSEKNETAVNLLKDLVAQDTVNPPGNEYRAAKVMTNFLDSCGITWKNYEKKQGRSNIIAKIGKGKPSIFVPAHLDVVPVNANEWKHNPFEIKIENGYAYGRGVNDNKGPLVSVLLLAEFLKKHEDELNGTFIIGGVADEECGSEFGVTYLLEQKAIDADYAIVPDNGLGLQKVTHGEKGLLQISLTFFGKAGHCSTPEAGLNVIWAANCFLNQINKLFDKNIGSGYLKQKAIPYFSNTTMSVSKISAGTTVNIIPDKCEITIDIRYTPADTMEAIISKVKKSAEYVKTKKLCSDFELNVLNHMLPFMVNENTKLIKAVQSAMKIMENTNVELIGLSGTTVSKQLVEAGIPSIGFSQNAESTAHTSAERLKLTEIPRLGIALGLTFFEITKK